MRPTLDYAAVGYGCRFEVVSMRRLFNVKANVVALGAADR